MPRPSDKLAGARWRKIELTPIRTQSKDPVIRDAAAQGVRVYRIAGCYFTASAAEMAREAHVSKTTVINVIKRRAGWAGQRRRRTADLDTSGTNQQSLADAVAEIKRLRELVFELGGDPDLSTFW